MAVCILFLLSFLNGKSQSVVNVDSIFVSARNNAFNNNYKNAQKDCRVLITHDSLNLDARNLLARIYAWENHFDSSLVEIDRILSIDSLQKEALATQIDVRIWSHQYDSALFQVNKALIHYPQDSGFISQYNKINSLLKNNSSPLSVSHSYENIGLFHSFDFFNIPWVRRWHVTSVEYARKRKNYYASVNMNVGDLVLNNERLYQKGVNGQLEGTLYHRLYKGYYYANYAWSPSILFPMHKGALEYFHPLTWHALDVSLGFRYFNFNQAIPSHLFVLTSSLGKGFGRSYLLLRYYLTPIKGSFYQSMFVKYSIYADNRLTNAMVVLGYGALNDEKQRIYQYEISSQAGPYIRIGGQMKIINPLYLYAETGMKRENYQLNNYRNRFDFIIGLRYIFNEKL